MSENSLTLVLQKKTRKILTPGKGKQKTEKFTPFGGNYFTNRAFNALSLGKVINETLGKRDAIALHTTKFSPLSLPLSDD